ncbi:MAG: phenylalanine--tRNA ligase subunit beta [Bdellovibrionales bacterium]
MKFTLSWLKQHLDTDAPLQDICDTLTAIGLEVEAVHDRGRTLAPFIIAHVLTAEKHPQADRLKVTTVDTGKEKIQVVCGAPNCRAGMKAVLARPGDVMPDSGQALKKGVIRGVESQGMLCAADELKLQDEETDGIIELPADAPVGESFARYGNYDDPVIEINLTPNRPDCAGVRGIARDLAAAGLGKLKPQDIKTHKGTEPSRLKVALDFPPGDNACPLFVGRLIRNIKNGPSPRALQDRLRAIGLRPISALVDISNFLTFDCARPLHMFDANKIKGNLWVRPARGGEKFAALNGTTYTLEGGMTAIGDDSGVVSLAGIMGGASTSCDDRTTDVFIESALFDPSRTARTGRALQIPSDARYRFERGVDPAFAVPGAELAVQLVLELCGTPQTVVCEAEIAGKIPDTTRSYTLDPKTCLRRAGVDVAAAEQEKILTALGFAVKPSGGKLSVTPPGWRPDIEGEADLVEEIVRIKGYDSIPATPLANTQVIPAPALDTLDMRANAARRALAGQGLMEAVTWSFMPGAVAAQFGGGDAGLKLLNPISADLDVMRPSILGNLVLAAKRNADRGFADAALFEVGPVYKNATPEGQELVATALRAGSTPRQWAAPMRPVDAYDAKADAIAALAAAGAPVQSLQVTEDAPGWYHPGRSGCLRLGPVLLATFGDIHPAVLMACDAAGPMAGCEIFIANIPQSRNATAAKPLLKLEPLQPVHRDFAFVVDRTVTAAKLIKAARDADKNFIRDVTVFDVYQGDRIEAGKKSVAVSVTLQPAEKTLTDAEIEAIAGRITAAVAKATGAVLRA